MTDLVVTKIAERGNKYEEGGQCIASHDHSIVFLPRGVTPGSFVRVRLIPIKDDAGAERRDARGAVMYRAEWALPTIPKKLARAISEEARTLRTCSVLTPSEMEAVVRSRAVPFPSEWSDFGHFYFAEDGAIFGSRFSPSALLLFEAFSDATESGLLELLAWLIDAAYYNRRQGGQGVGRDEAPDLPDEKISELQKTALGGWFSSGNPILATRLI